MARRVSVDMTGVESYTRCPEGTWLAKLKSIEVTEIQGSGDDGLKAQFEVIKGEAKGNSVFETFSLSEKALWKLKQFLEAVGMKATGKLKLDLDKLEGKVCLIDVIHDEYNGTKRAKISAYSKPSDSSDDEDEDDEDDDEDEDEAPKKTGKKPAPKKPSKKKPEPEPEEEDEEDDEEDDEDEEEEEPVKPAKKKQAAKTSKKTSKTKKKPEPEPEEDDEDDDWEDDDD